MEGVVDDKAQNGSRRTKEYGKAGCHALVVKLGGRCLEGEESEYSFRLSDPQACDSSAGCA